MVEISLSPHLHHIFTKPCVGLLQMNSRNIFQQTCEISCVGLLRMNGRNIFHYILRMNGRNIFITRLENEWSKYILRMNGRNISCVSLLRKSIAYEWSKQLHQTLHKLFLKLNERKHIEK